jgi:pentafunctional AROM polypeptide
MSRAAIYALSRLGVQTIIIYNRSRKNAEKLVDDIVARKSTAGSGLSALTLPTPTFHIIDSLGTRASELLLNCPTIIIDCLPHSNRTVGSSLKSSRSDAGCISLSVPEQWMSSQTGGVYLQLAYNTEAPSAVLCQVANKGPRGWIGVSGLEIFFEVAVAQFEYWCGRRAPRGIMQNALLEGFRSAN